MTSAPDVTAVLFEATVAVAFDVPVFSLFLIAGKGETTHVGLCPSFDRGVLAVAGDLQAGEPSGVWLLAVRFTAGIRAAATAGFFVALVFIVCCGFSDGSFASDFVDNFDVALDADLETSVFFAAADVEVGVGFLATAAEGGRLTSGLRKRNNAFQFPSQTKSYHVTLIMYTSMVHSRIVKVKGDVKLIKTYLHTVSPGL